MKNLTVLSFRSLMMLTVFAWSYNMRYSCILLKKQIGIRFRSLEKEH